MAKMSTRHSTVTTYRLSFSDPKATTDKRFLGEAIFDMDDSAGAKTIPELAKEATRLGINPGGDVTVYEYPPHVIPERYKGQLIPAQLESLIPLVSDRLSDEQSILLEIQSNEIVATFGEEAACGAIYGWEVYGDDEFVRVLISA